ncbi:MAG: dephospho-CoA kinase [Pseudobdellovibrio sp.]
MNQKMKWVGLTGGIATGKSTASKIIQEYKIPVIDADLIAHQMAMPGQLGYENIVVAFGENILTSEKLIDRKKLGQIIFNSPEKKIVLEKILHPLIQFEVEKLKNKFENSGHKICFYDVPLLFENKSSNKFFATVLIWCDADTQLARLKARNSFTVEQAYSRIKAQLPLSEKLPQATFCIDNSTTESSLQRQIKHLLTVSL